MPIRVPRLSETECERFLAHVRDVHARRVRMEWPASRLHQPMTEARSPELDLARKVRRMMRTGPITAEWIARKLLDDPAFSEAASRIARA